jgi:anti-sigma factor (TIGR02949 family)
MGRNCKEVVELLQDFLEGDLAETDQQDLREHIERCPPCVEFINTYQKTSDLCRKVLAREMPTELADRLTSFLRSRIRKA